MRVALVGGLLGAVLSALAAGTPPTLAQQAGDPARGAEIFAAKGCGRCHAAADAGGRGPALGALRRPQGAYELAGRFWNHAPGMFTALGHERLPWPDITVPEMTDLMAFLGADAARDAAADLGRGHVILVTKGCLKCHALRGEGARVARDLAGARDLLEPAPVWAAVIWRHTPRMAAVALERQVLYPRFADAEMRHLVAFLLQEGTR